MLHRFIVIVLCLANLAKADAPPATKNEPAHPPQKSKSDSDAIFDLGKSLFDEYAPAEVKEQYDFPSKEQWDAFVAKLQKALDGDSFEDLAAFEPQARAALLALRTLPDGEDYASWLEEKLDFITAAKQITQPAPPPQPNQPQPPASRADIPQYDLWLQRVSTRPLPPNAEQLLPLLQEQFSHVGSPRELAWLAEVESTFNPYAKSPAGARGLYQLMPETAKGLGLSTFLPDDRTDPKKSSEAAARLLKRLYSRFGDWPLAIAAYNAGEGRVSRTLTARKAKTFAEIAPALSVETRLYVPKVLATIAHRTGTQPEALSAPGIAGDKP